MVLSQILIPGNALLFLPDVPENFILCGKKKWIRKNIPRIDKYHASFDWLLLS
jgi:hypothetical protein